MEETLDKNFLKHHAEAAIAYVRLVEEEAKKLGDTDKGWYKEWRKALGIADQVNEPIVIEGYNDVPVHYCSNCLSLRIRGITEVPDLDFCEECGGTCIEQTHIAEWDKLYTKRYGFKFINR